METKTITSSSLVDMVKAGAVYCSNGDAAHTIDFPEDGDEIAHAIKEHGFRELNPDSEDFDEYADALVQLDMHDVRYARIFKAGIFTFSPDGLRDM